MVGVKLVSVIQNSPPSELGSAPIHPPAHWSHQHALELYPWLLMSRIPSWLILSGVPQMGDQYTMLLVALTSALLLALTLTIRIARRLLRSHHGVNRDLKANLS
jgi:hypothetical protein